MVRFPSRLIAAPTVPDPYDDLFATFGDQSDTGIPGQALFQERTQQAARLSGKLTH